MRIVVNRHSIMILKLMIVLILEVPPVNGNDSTSSDLGSYVWDLSSLYPNDRAWEAERQEVVSGIKTIGEYKGTLSQGPQAFADALDAISELRSRVSKMYIYATLSLEVNTKSVSAQRQYDASSALESQVESKISFMRSEITEIGDELVRKWIDEEPKLEIHRARINRILRESEYTLALEAQAVIESMSKWPRSSVDFFDVIHESDLGWPTIIDSEGNEIVVDRRTYMRLRRSQNSEERSRGAEAFFNSLSRLEKMFGMLYTNRIEADLIIARHRNFDSGIDALWFLRDGLPTGSHKAMITAARNNISTLRRFARLRGEAINNSNSGYADLSILPGGIKQDFSISEAMRIAIEAVKPLGTDFQSRLLQRFEEGWMHLPPSENKRATYGIYPPIGGANPYFMISYQPTYRHSRAFTGGAVLMMSFGDIPKDRVPDTRDDPGVYGNAVIYAGDMLHDDYLYAHANGDSERAAYLVQALDLLWRNFFVWTIVAELDVAVEQLIIDGSPPNGREISDLYLRLLREYYGGEANGIRVDERYAREWMTFPVPFLSYEHHFWPTAIAAASMMAQRLKDGAPKSGDIIHKALGRGNSDRSYGIFMDFGIDLTSDAPYKFLIKRMNDLMDELENTIAE